MTLNVVVLYSRMVRLGELQSDALVNSRMLVAFTERAASVWSKVKDALRSKKQLILIDHNGVELFDSRNKRCFILELCN